MNEINGAAVAVFLALWGCTARAQVVVTPRVLETDLRKLPPSPVWTPGSPVREVPDLKRTDAPDPAAVTLDRHTLRLADRSIVVYSVDGARLAGPLAFGSLWPPSAEPCGVDVEWAPAIQVDRAAGRWLISRWFQPMQDGKVPLCMAISRTSDPVAGGWWLYDFALAINRNEAPLEVSKDAYRLSGDSDGKRVQIVFDRTAMLAGKPSGFTASAR